MKLMLCEENCIIPTNKILKLSYPFYSFIDLLTSSVHNRLLASSCRSATIETVCNIKEWISIVPQVHQLRHTYDTILPP